MLSLLPPVGNEGINLLIMLNMSRGMLEVPRDERPRERRCVREG